MRRLRRVRRSAAPSGAQARGQGGLPREPHVHQPRRHRRAAARASLAVVDARTSGEPDYLPERALARFLEEERGETEVVVYALDKTGVEPARHAYEAPARHVDVDAIVLVHGGTDILMRGDEAGLGTSALLPSMPEVSTYLEESEVMRARGACHWTTRKLAHVARAGSTSLGSR